MTDRDPHWYRSGFFRDYVRHIATRIHPERTMAEVDFLTDTLDLRPGAKILDIACGSARHSVELTRRGFRVTGLDLDETSLDLARKRAKQAGVDVTLVRADMRKIPFTSEFDAAINLHTAFGYLETEAEDEKAMAAFARALKPGGKLILDTRNLFWVVRNFSPRRWEDLPKGARLFGDDRYDALTGRIESRWTIQHESGGQTKLTHSLRLYTPREMVLMMQRAGLHVERLFGSLSGEEFGLEQVRAVVLAVK